MVSCITQYLAIYLHSSAGFIPPPKQRTEPKMTYQRETIPAMTLSFLANTLLLLAAPIVTAIFLAQTF